MEINDKQYYLWRPVDQDGEVVDVYLQATLDSVRQVPRFLGARAAVSNPLNLARHRVRAEYYRNFRISAFADWSRAVV